MAIRERAPQPPQGVYLFDAVRVQILAKLSHRIQTPLTITRKVDPYKELIYYSYQVGTPTKEHPVGLCTGLQKTFLGALERGLEAALKYENAQRAKRRKGDKAGNG